MKIRRAVTFQIRTPDLKTTGREEISPEVQLIEDLASIRTWRYTSAIGSTREGKTLGGERKALREGKTPIRERKTPIREGTAPFQEGETSGKGKHHSGKEKHPTCLD